MAAWQRGSDLGDGARSLKASFFFQRAVFLADSLSASVASSPVAKSDAPLRALLFPPNRFALPGRGEPLIATHCAVNLFSLSRNNDLSTTNPTHTMNTDPNPKNETSTQSGITRRSFVKRTGGAVIATTLALHCFRNEANALTGVSYQNLWGVVKSTHNYYTTFVCLSREEAEVISGAFIRNGGNVTSEWGTHADGTTPHETQNPDPFNPDRFYTDNNDGTCTVTILGSVEFNYAWY